MYHDTILLKSLLNAFPILQGLPSPWMYTFSEYDEANYFSLKQSLHFSGSLHQIMDLTSLALELKIKPTLPSNPKTKKKLFGKQIACPGLYKDRSCIRATMHV